MLLITLPNILLACLWGFLVFATIRGCLDVYGLSKKDYTTINIILPQILCYILTVSLYFTQTNAILNIIVCFFWVYSILSQYNIAKTNQIFLTFIIYVVNSLLESFLLLAFSFLTNISTESLIATPLSFQVIKTLVQFIPFAIVKTLVLTKHQKLYSRKFTSKLELGFLLFSILIPLSSIILLLLLLEIAFSVETPELQLSVMLSLILVLNLNISAYYSFKKCLDMAENETDSRLLQEQIKFYESHFSSSQEHTDEIRKLKHDFKYHLLSALPKIVEDYKKTDDIDGIDTILGDIFHESHVKYTNIPMLDVILNYQVNKANKLNISLDITSDYITQLNFDSQWLCVILGNALDNAIECCQNLEDKSIVCSMKERNLNLYITISNSFEEPLKFVDGIPLSKKTGYKNHGTGLKSILQLVEKNEGICHFSTEDNTFSINLILNFL